MKEKKENYRSDNPCTACLLEGEDMICFHHLQTRGAGGGDGDQNLISVCLSHHNEFHQKGTSYMAKKYPRVKKWLLDNSWFYCTTSNKWRHGES